MHPGKWSVFRAVQVLVLALFMIMGPGPGRLMASSSLNPVVSSSGGPAGASRFLHVEPRESLALRGATDAGRSISDSLGFLGTELPGMLGNWAGHGAFMNITYLNLMTCLVLLLMVFVFDRIIKSYINAKVREILARKERLAEMGSFWDALSKPLSLFIIIYGTFLALAPVLVELKKVEGLSLVYLVASKAADFAGYIAIFWFIYRLVNVMESFLRKKILRTDTQLDDTLVPLLGRTARICIIIIGTAIVVKNVTGLDFGPLLASLGIGGMAVAFAAKDSIGNFLGSLTILFDKPFTVGDRIVLEGHDGVVEELGFRSTRIRTVSGSQVSIPNEKIINTTVENVGRRPGIRWHAVLSIGTDTRHEKVERAVEILKQILHDHEGMRPERPPQVHFSGFGDKCMKITITAWYHHVEGSSYEEWVQKTCLEIVRSFEAEEIALMGGA